jgi:SAM-dependent methyltransferase
MECLGLFFVEYLKARNGGHGIPDVVPKMGQVFERVGRGERYEAAFKKAYGPAVDKAVDELVDLIKQTKDDSNLLHHFEPSQSREVIWQVARALRPGGLLVIQDLFTPSRPDRPVL